MQTAKFVLAAFGPAAREFHRAARFALGGDVAFAFVGRALVKLHDDVGVQNGLNLNRDLGRHKEFVAIHGGRKLHAFFADFAHIPQRPNLKTARIGEDGLVPGFKLVQAAKLLHDVQPWAHPQMEGVAQNDLRIHLVQAARHHAFDGAVSANGHKNRGLHDPVIQAHLPTARACCAVLCEYFKFQHRAIVADALPLAGCQPAAGAYFFFSSSGLGLSAIFLLNHQANQMPIPIMKAITTKLIWPSGEESKCPHNPIAVSMRYQDAAHIAMKPLWLSCFTSNGLVQS